MRKQKRVWINEHENNSLIPALAEKKPRSGVVYFVDFLKRQGVTKGNAIDVGCGKGRNSVFLAANNFLVYGMDYVQNALGQTKLLAEENSLQDKIKLLNTEIDEEWSFENEFFDVAIDCFSSIDVETKKGREMCRNELFRTLKKGGYAFVSVVSAQDELEKQLRQERPGKEKNSVYYPAGKFQKDYDEDELLDFYKDFELIELKTVKKPAFRLGKSYAATNYWLILRKPV